MTKSTQKFSIIWIIIILLLVSAGGVVLYKTNNKYKTETLQNFQNKNKDTIVSERETSNFIHYRKGKSDLKKEGDLEASNKSGTNEDSGEYGSLSEYDDRLYNKPIRGTDQNIVKHNKEGYKESDAESMNQEAEEGHKNKDQSIKFTPMKKDTGKNTEDTTITNKRFIVQTDKGKGSTQFTESGTSGATSTTINPSYIPNAQTADESQVSQDTGDVEEEKKDTIEFNPFKVVKVMSREVNLPEGSVIIARASESKYQISRDVIIKESQSGPNIMPIMQISLDNPATEECEGLKQNEKVEFYLKAEESEEEQLLFSDVEIDYTSATGLFEKPKDIKLSK
ncbi:MAG: hypothetical protein ACMUJM_06925 [bacterium]